MSIVRYPGLLRVEPMAHAYSAGLEELRAGKTFLEFTANKITLHLSVNIVAPANRVSIMPQTSIQMEDRPSEFARGLCAMNGKPVFVRVAPTGAVGIDPQAPIDLLGHDWLIGTIEWMRRVA